MSEDAHVEVKCKHCGERIVLVNYLTGQSWTHQPAGASFQDGTHQYCHRTVAEPDMTDRRPHSREPEVLVIGLCGNRDDHEPHRVDNAAVAGGGSFWCGADQSERLPYKLERKQAKGDL